MALYRMVASGTSPGESWSFTLHAEGSLSTGDAATAFGDALTACWAAGMDDVTTADIDLAVRWDGVKFHFYVNDVEKATIAGTLPTVALTPSINWRTGATAAITLSVAELAFVSVEA